MADEEKKDEQTTSKEEQTPKEVVVAGIDAEKLRHKKITEEKFANGDLFYFNQDEWLIRHKGSDGEILQLSSGLPVWVNANSAVVSYSPTYYSPTVATILGHFTGINNAMANFLTHAMFISNGLMVRTGAGSYGIITYSTSPSANAIPRADGSGYITSWVSGAGAVMDSDFSSNGVMYRSGSGSYTTYGMSQTPTANYIPRADANGKLDSWITDASTSAKGKVKLANCLGGTADSPTVVAANCNGTILTFGNIPDGAMLMRYGSEIKGAT